MAPKKNYTPFQMAQAIEAVRKGEKIAIAAKKFGVPRITLHDKISGKTPVECAMGPKTCLSAEEESILEKWVLEMAEKHIPITRDELLDSVQRIILDQKKENPFTDNRPGRKWYNLFLNRHPALSERTAQNLTTARDAVTEEDIKRWFEDVESYLREKNLTDVLEDPARIFNTDERAFYLSPKVGKVLAKKGDKHVYQSSGDEKDNLTVLITGNAAGQLAPPMVVFAYERIPSTISSQFPDDWAIGRSQSGWMCGSTFYEYIENIFNLWLIQQNIKKPVVFYLDGHRSHLTLHLSILAIFRPLKTYWKKAVKDWKLQHLGQNLKKENFASVLKAALELITENCIKNGFRAGGLYPFGPDYVDLTKIKSRQQKSQISTDQTIFFKYLEKEVVAKLGTKKLQLFNELFYKSRDELNSRLNNEDQSLNIIWASNKYIVERSVCVLEPSSIQAEHCHNNVSNSVPLNEITASNESASNILTSLTGGQESETTKNTNNVSINEEPNCFTVTDSAPKEYTANSAPLNEITTSNDSVSNILTSLTGGQESETTNNTYNVSINEEPICFTVTDSAPKEYTPNSAPLNEITTSNDSASNILTSLTGGLESDTTNNISINDEQNCFTVPDSAPKESTPKKVGISFIPSPFKRNLPWPEEIEDKKRKRKLREKFPFAITSQPWRDYHIKKDMEKREKEKQKEINAKQREEKRQLKQREIENKKQKRLKDLENKNKKNRNRLTNTKPNDASSDNTDTEVNYADSDDSYNMELEEEKTDNEKSDTSESEDAPLIRYSKPAKTYSSGDYVIIKYEGEFFPGVIENVCGNKFEISNMTFSVGNTFKWPEKEDKIWYQKSDIVKAIAIPVLCNKRGFFTVPEMKEYQPFTM